MTRSSVDLSSPASVGVQYILWYGRSLFAYRLYSPTLVYDQSVESVEGKATFLRLAHQSSGERGHWNGVLADSLTSAVSSV